MKKFSMIMMAVLLGTASLWARPALKKSVNAKQPDGTNVTIWLHGDEYRSYNTTDDGYTVVKNDRGFFVYAKKEAGLLVGTDIVAHDATNRTLDELSFLQTMPRHLTADMSETMLQTVSQTRASRAQRLAQHKAQRVDYSKFKGLIILVEYNDCKFRNTDYKEIMEGMVNQEHYTGTDKTNVKRKDGNNSQHIDKDVICTGSMRDYFRDNSNGIFTPTFDIIGPVTVNRSQYYSRSGSSDRENWNRGQQLMTEACTAADPLVDFSKYDFDNDGLVDIVYFIFAGHSSYVTGNNSKLLWPHQSDLSYTSVRKDGIALGYYSCSTELFGSDGTTTEEWSVLEGIGTICHEFGHALGLPDFYDVDYTESGGQSDDPGKWSVMANGADYNLGRTPCGYSLFERYSLGFTKPQVISGPGTFSIDEIGKSNAGYRLNTPVNREYFMLENRQQNKWDSELPGHGMLIFRVDSTNTSVWRNNTLNCNPKHNYYELVRAGGVKRLPASGGLSVAYGAPSDPFPGTANVTTISNVTSPASLKTWAGSLSTFGLRNITEKDGQISFEVYRVDVLTDIVLQPTATIGTGTTLQLVTEMIPETATNKYSWASDNESVATVSATGLVRGISAGTARITITADNGVSATCTVTVKDMPIAKNIAEFRQLEEGSEVLLQFEPPYNAAQVLYVNGSDIYLRDVTGSIMLKGTGINVKKGDRLTGMVYGRLAYQNRMAQLVGIEGLTNSQGLTIVQDDDVKATELHISQLNEQCYADMVTVKKATLMMDNGLWAHFGDKKVRLYNTLNVKSPRITIPTDMTKRYDVTAIYGTNVLNGEVIDELYLLQSPKAVNYTAPTAITLPATTEMEVGRMLQLEPGISPAEADVFLIWTSSNDQVVSVDKNGKLTSIANGVATITVTDGETGLKASCNVTVGDRITAPDIAAFKTMAEGTEADLLLNNAQVLYVQGNTLFVRDGTGALMISGTGLQAEQNQILNGKIFGMRTSNNRMPVLSNVDEVTNAVDVIVTDGEQAVPRKVLTHWLTDNDLCDLVLVNAATLKRENGLYAVGGDVMARLYNTFGISGIRVPSEIDGKFFNITAIFSTALISGKVGYELRLLKSPEETTAADGIETIGIKKQADVYYDLNGRRLNGEPAHGVYLMRQNGRLVKKAK